MLRLAILGDDFTPSHVFESALEVALSSCCRRFEIVSRDMASEELRPFLSTEVEEAFGRPALFLQIAREAHFLITTFAPVTRAVFDSIPSLVAIACGRGRPVNVNVGAATEHEIPVLFALGRNAQSVAEYTLAVMLLLLRQIPAAAQTVRSGRWLTARQDSFEKPSGPELRGRRVGIIGYGQIGRCVAKLVGAFGAKVMVCEPDLDSCQIDIDARRVALDVLLQESDIISVHARISSGARPILGAKEFARMKCKPIVINTARAQAVDNDALIRALRDNQVSAACLDVFHEEPLLSKDALFGIDSSRLLLTPHVAGMSRDVPTITATMVAEGIAAVLRQKTPNFVANPACLNQCWKRLKELGEI